MIPTSALWIFVPLFGFANNQVFPALADIISESLVRTTPELKLVLGHLRSKGGCNRGYTPGAKTFASPVVVVNMLLDLIKNETDKSSKCFNILNEASPHGGITYGEFLRLFLLFLINDKLFIKGKWAFCYGTFARALTSPQYGYVNAGLLVSIRDICDYAKRRFYSLYYLRARQRAAGTEFGPVEWMLQEMEAEHDGLIELVKGVKKGQWIQLFADAGTNPHTGEDQAVSFAFCLHEKPTGSPLDDGKFDALDPIRKLIHWLTYGPPAYILACFVENTHSNGRAGFNRIVCPWLQKREDILYVPGFGVEDISRVVCRNDWTKAVRNAFLKKKTRSVYLIELSARLVSCPASEDQCLKPESEFKGVAHTFYPHCRKKFGTETVPGWFDGVVMAKVEGLTPEERQTMRSKLEAAVGGSSVDLHYDIDEDDDDDDEEEEEEEEEIDHDEAMP